MRIPTAEILRHIAEAVAHYEKSAPPVAAFLDDLYVRMCERPETVLLVELSAAASLEEGGVWEQPNYAANRFYKLAHRLGKDTTGMAGF